ncbi:MAG: hypothetical protein JXA69_17440 [Phycisphaerae bacterium]|nr:hypothetical protein [Phycisphaerae bacterium]
MPIPSNRPLAVAVAIVAGLLSPRPATAQDLDLDKYMPVDELRRGMTGFARTVLAGTEISTFDVEVVSVMRNAFASNQDVILVRCKGAAVEHSGIARGMSGSPVYITDSAGRNPRMIGAIAYGWSFNKDALGGVQPIAQMLAIEKVAGANVGEAGKSESKQAWRVPQRPRIAPEDNRFGAILQGRLAESAAPPAMPAATASDLCPLRTPVMTLGASPHTLTFMREQFEGSGLEPVASGASGDPGDFTDAKLEPGATLCVPIMQGDRSMAALGTCTEVIGDRVLAFGHSFYAEGSIELPMATGGIHTIVPSLMTSFKLGASANTVGTLVRDEYTGIYGRLGRGPAMIPCQVRVQEAGEEHTYNYELVHHEFLTPRMLGVALFESLFARRELPKEHTLRYTIDITFENLGAFRSANITSQRGAYGIAADATMPASMLMENEFGHARIERASMTVTVEPTARVAQLERAVLARDRVKPGETIEVQVWWRRFRADPVASTYTLELPDDLPDGDYELTVCSARAHVAALAREKPYLFRVDSMAQILEAMNLVAGFADDRVFLRLALRDGGLSVGKDVLPDLPSFRQRILADAKRSDVERYKEALVVEHPAPFTVDGSRSFTVKVDKQADQ